MNLQPCTVRAQLLTALRLYGRPACDWLKREKRIEEERRGKGRGKERKEKRAGQNGRTTA